MMIVDWNCNVPRSPPPPSQISLFERLEDVRIIADQNIQKEIILLQF
jgi:hypothetical protein